MAFTKLSASPQTISQILRPGLPENEFARWPSERFGYGTSTPLHSQVDELYPFGQAGSGTQAMAGAPGSSESFDGI